MYGFPSEIRFGIFPSNEHTHSSKSTTDYHIEQTPQRAHKSTILSSNLLASFDIVNSYARNVSSLINNSEHSISNMDFANTLLSFSEPSVCQNDCLSDGLGVLHIHPHAYLENRG